MPPPCRSSQHCRRPPSGVSCCVAAGAPARPRPPVLRALSYPTTHSPPFPYRLVNLPAALCPLYCRLNFRVASSPPLSNLPPPLSSPPTLPPTRPSTQAPARLPRPPRALFRPGQPLPPRVVPRPCRAGGSRAPSCVPSGPLAACPVFPKSHSTALTGPTRYAVCHTSLLPALSPPAVAPAALLTSPHPSLRCSGPTFLHLPSHCYLCPSLSHPCHCTRWPRWRSLSMFPIVGPSDPEPRLALRPPLHTAAPFYFAACALRRWH